MKLRDLEWGDWIYALLNATIGGGASSVAGWMGAIGFKTAGLDVPQMNFNTLWIFWVSGSGAALFFYLKQSPLPKLIKETTTTLTVKETTTEQNETSIPPANPQPPAAP